MCVYVFLLMGSVHQFLQVVYDRLVSYDRWFTIPTSVKWSQKRFAFLSTRSFTFKHVFIKLFFFFIYAFIFRGKAEGAKSLLDLSIIVCRTSPGTSSPKPHSLVFHSKRQVKANVSCNAILEEGSYMIGMLLIPREVKSSTLALRWCCVGWFATTIFSATQRCNVATMLQPFETMSQQCCNAVLR